MKIQTYNDMTLAVLSQSACGSKAMQVAVETTQKRKTSHDKPLSEKTAKFLLDAEHTSIFEHASMTFLASGISRSLLAQVTRQRMFSFTSASQHYQDYRDYPMSIRPGWDKDSRVKFAYEGALNDALTRYVYLIEHGEPPEEARQILPNACTVNLVITANPRALAEFLRVRLCDRNTREMKVFAQKLYSICASWIPEIFEHVSMPCIMDGECNQGKMSCRN